MVRGISPLHPASSAGRSRSGIGSVFAYYATCGGKFICMSTREIVEPLSSYTSIASCTSRLVAIFGRFSALVQIGSGIASTVTGADNVRPASSECATTTCAPSTHATHSR